MSTLQFEAGGKAQQNEEGVGGTEASNKLLV